MIDAKTDAPIRADLLTDSEVFRVLAGLISGLSFAFSADDTLAVVILIAQADALWEPPDPNRSVDDGDAKFRALFSVGTTLDYKMGLVLWATIRALQQIASVDVVRAAMLRHSNMWRAL